MFCTYYIPFVFMKIIFFITYFYIIMVLEYFLLKVNIREITALTPPKKKKKKKEVLYLLHTLCFDAIIFFKTYIFFLINIKNIN